MIRVSAPASLWRRWTPVALVAVSSLLGACASTGQAGAGGSASLAAPSVQPASFGVSRYRIGAPYEANGVWFVPAEQPSYQDTGTATVYAPSTATTADGERFDAAGLTAAHATLPMPAMVEVTNLETGRRIEVRINDRGATRPGQVIELSRGAAEALGFAGRPSAKVKVRYLRPGPIDGVARTYAAAAPVPASAPVAVAAAPPAARPAGGQTQQAALGGFAVQAGAFSDRGNAERVAAKLAAAGQAAIRPLDRGGVQLFRVVVGPWSSETQASAAREQVAALGFGEAKVVKAF